MNGVHIHLVVNHFPIITPILALLILIAGFIFKSQIVKRVAFALFIFGSLFTFAAMATGDGAEDFAEELGQLTRFWRLQRSDLTWQP